MQTGIRVLSILSVTALGSPVIAATQLIDATSTQIDTSVSMTVGQSAVVHAMSDTVGFNATMPGDPMNGLAGKCFGAVVADAMGATGSGVCVLAGPDGDSVIVHWVQDPKVEGGGNWHFGGGTGRWATALGGGTFSETPPNAAMETTLHVTGAVDFH